MAAIKQKLIASRLRLLLSAILIPVVMSGGVLAYGQATATESRGDRESVATQSNSSEAIESFSVFRRAQRTDDRPARVEAGERSQGVESRLLHSSPGIRAFAVLKADNEVCLVIEMPEVGTAGCAPANSAGSDRPIVLTAPSSSGPPIVVGLLHDGPARVQVTRPGGRSEVEGVANNSFVVRGEAERVTWVGPSGETVSQSLADHSRVKPGDTGTG